MPQIARAVRGRPLPQGDAGRVRLPPALGAGQPPADASRSSSSGSAQVVFVSATPGAFELEHSAQVVEQVDPADRAGRSRGRGPADQGSRWTTCSGEIRRTVGRRRAGPGHDPDQEDGGGPDRLPARAGRAGAVPALRHRHASAHRDPPRPAPRGLRRARRHQPAARGARPARGRAGRHPRRRQGGLPALGVLADPDHRPGGPQRGRQGGALRRHHDRLDAGGRLGDPTAARGRRRPTTSSTASTPRRSASRSPTSSNGCAGPAAE